MHEDDIFWCSHVIIFTLLFATIVLSADCIVELHCHFLCECPPILIRQCGRSIPKELMKQDGTGSWIHDLIGPAADIGERNFLFVEIFESAHCSFLSVTVKHQTSWFTRSATCWIGFYHLTPPYTKISANRTTDSRPFRHGQARGTQTELQTKFR